MSEVENYHVQLANTPPMPDIQVVRVMALTPLQRHALLLLPADGAWPDWAAMPRCAARLFASLYRGHGHLVIRLNRNVGRSHTIFDYRLSGLGVVLARSERERG